MSICFCGHNYAQHDLDEKDKQPCLVGYCGCKKFTAVPVVVRPSVRHGNGLFSVDKITKLTHLGVAFVKRGSTGVPDNDYQQTTLGRLINHSKEPNLVLQRRGFIYILANTKVINKDEELTLDYEMIPWYEKTEELKKFINK